MSGENAPQLAPAWYEEMKVDGVRVRIFYGCESDPEVTEMEAQAYVEHSRKRHPFMKVDQINLLVIGDEVEITYRLVPVGSDRIPRLIIRPGWKSYRLEKT